MSDERARRVGLNEAIFRQVNEQIRGLNQDFDTAASNSYDLHYDYGTSIFDRKIVFNLFGMYDVPFGRKGHDVLSRVVRGWSISPIVNISSGLPLKVLTGSTQEFGQGGSSNSGGAVLIKPNDFGNSVHSGLSSNVSNIAMRSPLGSSAE